MLAPILESTRGRIAALPPMAELRSRAADSPPVRDLVAALSTPGLGVIAEVKRRSPSRGDLDPEADPTDRARHYSEGGAAAISVLTEPDHFAGTDGDLIAVRRQIDLPVLRKDFTLDPAQVWEARAIGADAVLLIVAALDDDTLSRLLETSAEAGMAALVEVHTAPEAERALAAGAAMVGVNNRDLETFEVDLATAEKLAPMLAGNATAVAESGIFTAEDAARMSVAGYDAILVGEALMRSPDPRALLAELRGTL